jgi:Xaa-Pro aminopeptidase
VVTLTSAALWTDSRYFIAAAEQLECTEFQLMKLKVEGTPTIAEWLGKELADAADKSVGIDGMTASVNTVEELIGDLRKQGGITLQTNFDEMKRIWKDRPAVPVNKVELQPIELTGEDVQSKLQRIRKALREEHADGMLMAALDDIAWTLNLRGSDVHCNPVFVSYLLIASQSATLYINKEKLTNEVCDYLKTNNISIAPYEDVSKGLRDYFEYNILLDPDEVNYTLFKSAKREVVRATSPVPLMKAVKHQAEQEGFRRAMVRDGVAMVKFLKWLDESDEPKTEVSIDRKLISLRAEQPRYRDLSFDTIAGYGPHGAIVHYEATEETDVPLKPEGLLLLDSGAQYQDGTTDITRTIALGPLTDEQRHVYTLVLKGHIALSNAIFPNRTAGTQLDVLARQFMWREGMNYLHGTGHGVGSYLSVHEGPHQFRMEWKPQPLIAGMTITVEPGIYLAGRFGVRIENTMLIVPALESEFGSYLKLEPLTLCPIDLRPVCREQLTDEERQWLNDYHQTVYDRLSPLLESEERQWLRAATEAI